MKELSEKQLENTAGGNKFEDICKIPGVKLLLKCTLLPGVPELLNNKEFTDKLSEIDIDDKEGYQKLFKDYGVELKDKHVELGQKLMKPFIK